MHHILSQAFPNFSIVNILKVFVLFYCYKCVTCYFYEYTTINLIEWKLIESTDQREQCFINKYFNYFQSVLYYSVGKAG